MRECLVRMRQGAGHRDAAIKFAVQVAKMISLFLLCIFFIVVTVVFLVVVAVLTDC